MGQIGCADWLVTQKVNVRYEFSSFPAFAYKNNVLQEVFQINISQRVFYIEVRIPAGTFIAVYFQRRPCSLSLACV